MNGMNKANHLISSATTLRDAFARLNLLSGSNMTLFVLDSEGRLIGSLTDGDLRRAIIAGCSLDDRVDKACHTDCMTLPHEADRYDTVRVARQRGISMIPALDSGRRITELIDLRTLRTYLPIDAVLMAGGRGERLRPLTANCPKPLLKVGEKAIIDYNIDELRRNGVNNIFVTVNYLKEMIIQHFSDPIFEGKVKCVAEPKRLGTMGSLSLIRDFVHDNILVMNSDLLTSLNFEDLYLAHRASGAALTVAAIPYTVSIPFAILRSEGRRVTGLTEKPTYNYFANAGVYIMRREIACRIPEGEYLDAPDLIVQLIADGEKVEYFPIEGTWIDIGSPDDYRYANELMSRPR